MAGKSVAAVEVGDVIDMTEKKEHVIINNKEELEALYEKNKNDIWVGFN